MNKFVPVPKDLWPDIQRQLSSLFCYVKFRVGTDIVDVQRRRVSESRSTLWVFVNETISSDYLNSYSKNGGQFENAKGEAIDVPDIYLKVWGKRKTMLYSTAEKAKMDTRFNIRKMGKKKGDELKQKLGYDAYFYSLRADFGSSAALVRQFRSIENIEIEVRDE